MQADRQKQAAAEQAARAAREAEEAATRQIAEAAASAAAQQQQLEQLLQRKRQGLPDEPGAADPEAVEIQVRLPGGSRMRRRCAAAACCCLAGDADVCRGSEAQCAADSGAQIPWPVCLTTSTCSQKGKTFSRAATAWSHSFRDGAIGKAPQAASAPQGWSQPSKRLSCWNEIRSSVLPNIPLLLLSHHFIVQASSVEKSFITS